MPHLQEHLRWDEQLATLDAAIGVAAELMPVAFKSRQMLRGVAFAAMALVGVLAIGPGFYIFYLFPNGRFVPPWTRWLALAWAGTAYRWIRII